MLENTVQKTNQGVHSVMTCMVELKYVAALRRRCSWVETVCDMMRPYRVASRRSIVLMNDVDDTSVSSSDTWITATQSP